MEKLTPKRRMLNAYRGLPVDTPPVAPEFWYYYPAKILGVDMITFQQEIPFWKALQMTFTKYGVEGWGAAFAEVNNPDVTTRTSTENIREGRFRKTYSTRFRRQEFIRRVVLDRQEPSSTESFPLEEADLSKLDTYVDMKLSEKNEYDLTGAIEAHRCVDEDYLLEFYLGAPFFDFFGNAMGFQRAVLLFLSSNDVLLESYLERYIACQKELVRSVCRKSEFESFAVGCSSSCNSLIGPKMWRRWDRPYIEAVTDEVHRQGKLIHLHFHGKSRETLRDFAEIGIDCVCPFERPPGGDIDSIEGLEYVRHELAERVTMNGNIHTVETLIRGKPGDVRREVGEIKAAFAGSRRFIIGTGDQVGRETPEENIRAMIDEARKRT